MSFISQLLFEFYSVKTFILTKMNEFAFLSNLITYLQYWTNSKSIMLNKNNYYTILKRINNSL